ncbi:MAG: outer membrane beta-barrel protein [Prevotella sp.]
MKKVLFSLVAALFMTVSANAQVYLGGNFGIASTKVNDGDNVTTYAVLPEVGYNIDKTWAIGAMAGFGKGTPVSIEGESSNYVTIQPYARCTFFHSKYINVFTDCGFGYTHYNHAGDPRGSSINEWQVGFKPGISVNLNPKFSFVAHIGFLGYKDAKYDYDDAPDNNAWGLDLDGNNVTFGFYYNF